MATFTRQRLIAVLLALAVVAASCGSDDTDNAAGPTSTDSAAGSTDTDSPSSTDGSASTAGGASTTAVAPDEPSVDLFDSYEGVTADTIKLGAIVTDLEELRELGLVDLNFGDPDLIHQTNGFWSIFPCRVIHINISLCCGAF